jgi:hypothetical protein
MERSVKLKIGQKLAAAQSAHGEANRDSRSRMSLASATFHGR